MEPGKAEVPPSRQSYEQWASSLKSSEPQADHIGVRRRRPFLWPLQGLVAFAMFAAAALMVLVGILLLLSAIFGVDLAPRGLGWILLPLAVGGFGWKLGASFGIEGIFRKAQISVQHANRAVRIWVACSILWVIAAVFYLIVAEPYGRWMSDEEYIHFGTVLVGPIIILAIAIFLFAWALKDQK